MRWLKGSPITTSPPCFTLHQLDVLNEMFLSVSLWSACQLRIGLRAYIPFLIVPSYLASFEPHVPSHLNDDFWTRCLDALPMVSCAPTPSRIGQCGVKEPQAFISGGKIRRILSYMFHVLGHTWGDTLKHMNADRHTDRLMYTCVHVHVYTHSFL